MKVDRPIETTSGLLLSQNFNNYKLLFMTDQMKTLSKVRTCSFKKRKN